MNRSEPIILSKTRSIIRSNNPWRPMIAPLSPNLNLTRPHRSHWQWVSGVKWNRLRFRKREFLNLIVINTVQQPESDRFKIGAEGNKNIPRKRSSGISLAPPPPHSPPIPSNRSSSVRMEVTETNRDATHEGAKSQGAYIEKSISRPVCPGAGNLAVRSDWQSFSSL